MYRALTFPMRLVLAVKYHARLGYSWHLAWVKSAR